MTLWQVVYINRHLSEAHSADHFYQKMLGFAGWVGGQEYCAASEALT
jgi:hypothetical protein